MYEEFIGLTKEEAKIYNRTASSLTWNMRTHIADMLKGNTVLDVGCGNGIDSGKYKPANYTGVDISEPLISAAREYNPNYRYYISDASHLPFPDKFVDFAFAIGVFENLPSLDTARAILSEMMRVSRKGVVIGWYCEPTNEVTRIDKVIGHFGKECNFPKYNSSDFTRDILDKSMVYIEPFGGTYSVWKISKT